jgi:hypothetical protein
MKQPTLFGMDVEPTFTNRAVNAVTFRGKMSMPIHRWYRLTPSFSPQLANDIADRFGLTETDLVLDPFSGVGTVPLCMKHRGVPACSIELNPYLHFVGTVKTRTYTKLAGIRREVESFVENLADDMRKLPGEKKAEGYLVENAAYMPPIHMPRRWWSVGNLMQLTCLRKVLLCRTKEIEPNTLDLIRMGALAILIPVSNAKHNHVSLTFAPSQLATVDVVEVLRQKYREMMDDLQAVASLPNADVVIYSGNSKEASKVLAGSKKISAVITSPPYPNRFSYARETRPHLFFLNFITDPADVGQMETDAIGGTWGKATSVLASGVEFANDVVRESLERYTGKISGNCDLMASYVIKYFNDIYTHAAEIAKVCGPSARLAYVIGNSKFFDHPLPSDEVLAEIFGHFGFSLDKIDRMRRRQSKTGLYEAVVFMRSGK